MAPLSRTAHIVLHVVKDAPPEGMTRHRIINAIGTVAEKTVRNTVSKLAQTGLLGVHIDGNNVMRYAITDAGEARLHETPDTSKRGRAETQHDGWTPGPWVHPIAAKMQGKIRAYHSTVTQYEPAPDPTTQVRPYYPPTRRNGRDGV